MFSEINVMRNAVNFLKIKKKSNLIIIKTIINLDFDLAYSSRFEYLSGSAVIMNHGDSHEK